MQGVRTKPSLCRVLLVTGMVTMPGSMRHGRCKWRYASTVVFTCKQQHEKTLPSRGKPPKNMRLSTDQGLFRLPDGGDGSCHRGRRAGRRQKYLRRGCPSASPAYSG